MRRLQWAGVALGVLWLVWLLAPILTPFVVAALLGWLGDPLVDRLQLAGRSRNTAVILVFALMALLLALVLVILVPLIEGQIATLIDSLPRYRLWVTGVAIPWIEGRTGLQLATNGWTWITWSSWCAATGSAPAAWLRPCWATCRARVSP